MHRSSDQYRESAAGRIAPSLVAILALAGLAAWWLLRDDPEAEVRAAHAELAELLSTPDEPAAGLPIARIRRLQSLFADGLSVTGDAGMFAGTHTADSIVQQVLAVHGALEQVELEFGEIRIEFPDATTARADFPAVLTARDTGGEMLTESREVESRMQRIDGDWRFVAFDLRAGTPGVVTLGRAPIAEDRIVQTAGSHLATGLPTAVSGSGARFLLANVIGEDSRELAPLTDADLTAAVGLVVCDRIVDGRRHFGRGTGTLVGSGSTVLTAAHVLSSNADRSGTSVQFDPVGECHFQQYDDSGELRFEVGFAHAVFGDYRGNSGLPNHDWAVLRTAEPLPAAIAPLPFAALELEALDRNSRVPISVVAFHADVRSRWRAPLKSEGRIFAVDYAGFARLAHTADMGRMSSGAALVRRTADGRAVVVGLHRSAANFGEFNLGVPVTPELHATLAGFAYGERPAAGGLLAAVTVPERLPPAL